MRWLAAGDVVICDRYRASSVAYGEAQGLDPAWLDEIQRYLPEAGRSPCCSTSRRRRPCAASPTGRDRYERDLALLGRVRESYRRQADARRLGRHRRGDAEG